MRDTVVHTTMIPESKPALILAVTLVLAPSGCRGKPEPARTDTVTAVQKAGKKLVKIPIYDAQGVRLPQEALPFGTPVPVGLEQEHEGKGWVRWSGSVEPEEVIAFYEKYLTIAEGTAPHEVGNSTRFLQARPRQPGNPGRPVEVRVIDELEARWSAVLIFDLSTINKARETNWDEVPITDPRKWKPSKPGEKVPSDLL